MYICIQIKYLTIKNLEKMAKLSLREIEYATSERLPKQKKVKIKKNKKQFKNE